ESAVRVVTGDHKFVAGFAGDGDFPIGLNHQRNGIALQALSEIRNDYAPGAEGRVQRAVGVIARQGNVTFPLLSGIKLNARPPSRHNFAVRLKRNSSSLVVIRPDVGSDKPALAEGGIERAVRV